MAREGPLHAAAVAATLAVRGVTHLVSVPAHLAALVDAERLTPLARVFSSGAPLPATVADALRARHGQAVVEVYGSTETGGIGWRETPDQTWTPFPDATIAVDSEGALLVSSPRLGPALPRPFVCADRVELLSAGRFRLLGRADGVMKVGGKRVSLREIEERLLTLPGVRDAAALGVPSSGARGEEIWVAASAPGWTPALLRERLLAWLDPVTVPRRIRVVPALPREATGKLVRDRLWAMLEAPAPPPRLDFTLGGEEVLPADPGTEARRLTVTVPADLHWFQGHFPGHPILPGVIQLERLVLRQTARIWPTLRTLAGVKRLKFNRPISPGARIALTLRLEEARGLVHFELSGDEGGYASGALVFAGGSP
jgi:acyl-CoA synthetase (AMP-forming)/AMP-acid ligase II/3-hydroxymyristoyl/3-hydroxydecanoyl-(acyl carrier protein) dehydratase